MIGFVLAPFVFAYNIAHWVRERRRKAKYRSPKIIEQDGSPSPIRMIPVVSVAVSAVSALAAFLAGSALIVVIAPFLLIVAAAIVLSMILKALGIGQPTNRRE